MSYKERIRKSTGKMLTARKDQLERILGEPKILNELSFTLGLMVIMVLEGVALISPAWMGVWYTALAVPLLVLRYFLYRRDKGHYFMLDYCYFTQVTLLLMVWWFPRDSPTLFYVVFLMTSGPLGGGIYMWRNSLVLHDLDRYTSTFIHFVPPLVMYCLRWHAYGAALEPPPFSRLLGLSLLLYAYWQVLYVLKTEIMDRRRFQEDDKLVTSLRWLSSHRPHPIYRYVKSKSWGKNIPGLAIIITVQLVYTLGTLSICYPLYTWRLANQAWLAFLFLMASWNGARYYFEVLAERHRREAEAAKKDLEDKKPQAKEKLIKLSSSKSRFFVTMTFLVVAIYGLVLIIDKLMLP